MRIVWSTKLETGVRTIDLQHEELVGMINELHDANAASSSRLVLDDILQRLNGYVVFHFGTEEGLIANLPSREAHVEQHLQQHRVFVEEIARMRQKAGTYSGQAMAELADYLSNWLYQHILQTDRQLANLLKVQSATCRQSS